ncbi:candidate endoglucanase from glycoside hydrolase family GH5 [Postia placenta Mad-698-R]|uniref:cellulase n=1 Tax=Postia placenta MAD-698-R-SB12 TaxID=670580 RepID=A0A1X6NF90_9APHY|nr:glycoside hydrolase family 5 protein [Postia placenta MAD-698-R-SB12]EED77764.1 candidate endoglucanase from glycoside hydrolase family GH5 [Postia placenta Mad-698-R]OSX67301.1 glycoside hydrolase family 5 protein [Postia placenta MAD-698-R-SB12]
MVSSKAVLVVLSTALASSGVGAQLIRLGGVNTAGYDFTVYTNGSFTNNAAIPPAWEYAHFSGEGANLYRVPFAWQEMTPELGGPINTTFLEQYYNVTVAAALASSPTAHVIVDLHNYARWNGEIISQGGPTNEQYGSIWYQLGQVYGNNDRLLFGVMNEPHDLDIPTWAESVQYVVNSIRASGATNYLLLPGSNYTSAQTFPTGAGPYLLNVKDPLFGTPERLIFDVHKYLDYDNSGTHAECVTNNTEVLETLVSWLQEYGRQAVLSETGGGNTASCETYLGEELAYVKSAYPSLVGFSVWAAGAFATDYILSMTPYANGTDQPLWIDAVRPNLP